MGRTHKRYPIDDDSADPWLGKFTSKRHGKSWADATEDERRGIVDQGVAWEAAEKEAARKKTRREQQQARRAREKKAKEDANRRAEEAERRAEEAEGRAGGAGTEPAGGGDMCAFERYAEKNYQLLKGLSTGQKELRGDVSDLQADNSETKATVKRLEDEGKTTKKSLTLTQKRLGHTQGDVDQLRAMNLRFGLGEGGLLSFIRRHLLNAPLLGGSSESGVPDLSSFDTRLAKYVEDYLSRLESNPKLGLYLCRVVVDDAPIIRAIESVFEPIDYIIRKVTSSRVSLQQFEGAGLTWTKV